ncbi:GNAT family N-acetyltransferase [Ancrocorticia populi]|uniref:GNAT family N-acetyltransferase n=1 Tax=Ancrocorticia populi TaxID=2175228 RepID=A0A2V1K6T2_9ACTO|nr:GNAT family N-acetyltransferase [Ancrocorticia populi]PWF26692.1 GNAT family N-acetyltransferase [Ancrocorticia populi]
MLPKILTTHQLRLDVPSLADADEVTVLCQDPEIQKWTTIPVPYGREDAVSFIQDVALPGWEKDSPTWFIRATTTDSSPILGAIGLTKSAPSIAEIGFWLAPEARGRGVMIEALQKVVDFGFAELGLEAIQYSCYVINGEPNWPSAKVAWRAGFTFEGKLRKNLVTNQGEAIGSLVGSLLKDDPRSPQHAWFGPSLVRPAIPDSRDPEALVRQFHETYGLPIVSDGPNSDRERVHMRMALVAEEFSELVGAVYGYDARSLIEEAFAKGVASDTGARDTVETADALADLVYVIYGMALELGIPMRDVLAEVQASNLSKLGSDGKPIYREDGKVLKGPGFFPPDIPRVLGLD